MAAKKKAAEETTEIATASGSYKILIPFTDAYTGAEYVPGDVVDFTAERAEQIRAAVGEGWIAEAQSNV